MSNTVRGLAAVLAITAAAFAPASALPQPKSLPVFDTRIAPQAPLDLPHPTATISMYFPDRAQRMNVSGAVLIDCAADAQGVLTDCKVLSETPQGWDFGEAALKAARAGVLRKTSARSNGRITTWVRFNSTESEGRGRPMPAQRLAGTAMASSLAAAGEPIVSFPVTFNRTAVLTEDLTNVNPLLKVVRAKAGAPGFFLGAFTAGQDPAVHEVWCFLTSRGLPANWVCVWVSGRGADGVVRSLVASSVAPYDPQVQGAALDTSKQSFGPVFEEKAVELPETPALSYRFKRWTATAAEVDLFANDRRLRTLTLNRGSDGSAVLDTAAGRYRLRPAQGVAQKAEVTPP